MKDIMAKAGKVKMLVLDVDGILSDGKITYDANGIETKSFSVKDGLGIKALRQFGIKTAIITGRRSSMVELRAQEMGVEHVIQGRDDKLVALQELLNEVNAQGEPLQLSDCAYMGDDLPDIKALQSVGFAVTVHNAHAEVIKRVDMVTSQNGGCGAVRELCDLILKGHGYYSEFIAGYLLDSTSLDSTSSESSNHAGDKGSVVNADSNANGNQSDTESPKANQEASDK